MKKHTCKYLAFIFCGFFLLALTVEASVALCRHIQDQVFADMEDGDFEETPEPGKETEKVKETDWVGQISLLTVPNAASAHRLTLNRLSTGDASAGYKGEVFSPPEVA